MIEMEKQRTFQCGCLLNNVAVESLVITLTIISALAITGENLLMYDLITVPEYINSSDSKDDQRILKEDVDVLDILDNVFHYASLVIAGIFFVEIFFKVCTLQKRFITKPWQIFDSLVVLVTLGVEIAFHLIDFDERALYSLTYIVVLRLWRVPVVCSMKAEKVRQSLEQDIELYISGRKKAEERCSHLEETFIQQSEIIKMLENMLQRKTGSRLRDMTNGDTYVHQNGRPQQNVYEGTDNTSAQKETPAIRRNLLRSKQNMTSYEMETEFNENIHSEEKRQVGKGRPLSDVGGRLRAKRVERSDSSPVKSGKGGLSGDATSKLSPSRPSDTLQASRPNRNVGRPRKRRSSTSEVIDYSNLNSPEFDLDSVFQDDNKDKTSSCPRLDSESEDKLDKSFNKDSNKNIHKKPEGGLAKKGSSASDTPSDASSTDTGRKGRRERKRRFTSCPEYVFTQRMNITSDESILIEDRHTIEDPTVYDNLAFTSDEDIKLQVLAEFDGTKTYRNEDGIPMTSL